MNLRVVGACKHARIQFPILRMAGHVMGYTFQDGPIAPSQLDNSLWVVGFREGVGKSKDPAGVLKYPWGELSSVIAQEPHRWTIVSDPMGDEVLRYHLFPYFLHGYGPHQLQKMVCDDLQNAIPARRSDELFSGPRC